MKKLVLALIFSFLLFSGFSDNQVWVKAKMPFNVHAGDRFTIEITINKLDLQNFAEFKQKLPAGFIAIEKNSGNADFSFNNQMVKFTWLRLPRVPKMTVSYDVMVTESVKGQFNLPGQFTYIYKNQRGTAVLLEDRINVYSRGEAFRNDIQPVNKISFPPCDPQYVQCLRVNPQFVVKQNGFVVKLLVSSGAIPSASKIEEIVPKGFTASLIDSKGATFSFENNKVEFIWKKMPEQRNFEISYRLVSSTASAKKPEINGKMFYFSGGQGFSIPVVEVSPDILNSDMNKDANKSEVFNFFKD